MDVFVSSCVCETCKLQLIQYSCVKIYYSILPYPVDQTTSSPPACLRSLPVLAAARMTHRRKHTIGETFNSIHILWYHKPNTDSNIPVEKDYRDGEHLPGSEGDHTDHVRHDNQHVHFSHYSLENHKKL